MNRAGIRSNRIKKDIKFLKERESGKTLEQVGNHFRVSRTMATLRIRREERRIRKQTTKKTLT